jgi:hypothetical protein
LDESSRTSVAVLIKNPTGEPVTIQDLQLGGKPIAEHLALSDPSKPNSPGKGVDWFDIRPRTIPAGGAAVILLGCVAKELRAPVAGNRAPIAGNGRPKLELAAVTDKGAVELSCPAPKPDRLKVACAAFDKDLKVLTVMVRNDAAEPVAIETVELNGKRVEPQVKGSPVPPGMVAVLKMDLSAPLKLSADCTLRVAGKGASATAWFRAYPAESLNYPFYGMHADKRDLEEKHMDVYVTRMEANAQIGHEIEKNGGTIPDALAKRLTSQAEQFGKTKDAWAWYVQDDAGWGRPRPQTLIGLGRFLREHGSPQAQFVCNPADTYRYAWTHDFYMNYLYHCTGQGADPTVFPEGRSLDLIRELNEPAPILYLVDTVGQGVRWITPAEEELASYAMLGRGARHFGWFLIPSVWDQGAELRGGIDSLEDRPWRYQEGATACVPVWNLVGNIAGVLKPLQPYLATSARLPADRHPEGVEVLPLLCKDDLVVTVLLNRRLRCLYPRDFPDGKSHGGIKLMPQRELLISHKLPKWVQPVRVMAFDHDRGLRDLRFNVLDDAIFVNVDAVDTATLLLVCPTGEVAAKLVQGINQAIFATTGAATPTQVRVGPGGNTTVTVGRANLVKRLPTIGGSPIRPDAFGSPENLPKRRWDVPDAGYRAALSVQGPLAGGTWVRASLPVEPGPLGPLGYFDPRSVAVVVNRKKLTVRVDCVQPVSGAAEGAKPSPPAGENAPSVYVQLPDELKAGETLTLHAYWTYAAAPGKETAALPDAEKPKEAVAAKTGGVEGFLLSAVEHHIKAKALESLSLSSEAKTYCAWAEARDPDGALLVERPLKKAAEREWELAEEIDLPDAATWVAAFAADRTGRVVGVELRAPLPADPLREIARVAGQVEALSCAGDGSWLLVGADKVYALDASGKGRGAVDLGENRRQQERYGPGRNVEQVAVRADGKAAFARTFRWNATTRQYENSFIQLLSPEGKPIARAECDWREGARFAADGTIRAAQLRGGKPVAISVDPVTGAVSDVSPPKTPEPIAAAGKAQLMIRRDPTKPRKPVVMLDGKEQYEVEWPPYTSQRFLLSDGRLLVATTQGIVRLTDAKGKQAWQVRKASRIDSVVVVEAKGLVAIAWKRYPHTWDWWCVPTLELLSLKDGKTQTLYEGVKGDDLGHLGTDLRLAASADGSRLFLGAQDGRIYALDVMAR